MNFSTISVYRVLIALADALMVANAGDPNILSDFILPQDSYLADANFFTFTGMRSLMNAPARHHLSSIKPPHTHPRSAELLFMVQGSLEVGLVDTTDELYSQTLQTGDMFVFPKGLVHYQYNTDAKNMVVAISAFRSANASNVDVVLAKSFKTYIVAV
ncbi:hypothetical protein AMTRI_Chr11g151080 [Amborella trichopoda]